MKTTSTLLLGLGLLTACGPSVPAPAPTGSQPVARDTIPAVPRVVSSSFNCTATAKPISGDLPGNPRDTANVVARFQPQAATNTVWDLLYATRYLLNTYYFGYSSADLESLHQAAYQNFKKTFPNALSTYTITPEVDSPMKEYVAPIQTQDEHTYYMNAQEVAYYKSVSNNTSLPAPVFGLSFAPVPGGNGLVITDVRGDGPAFAAGLRRGDVLLSIDGQALTRTVQATGADDSGQAKVYSNILGAAAARQTPVSVTFRRGSDQHTLNLTGTVLGAARLPWSEVVRDSHAQPYLYLRLPTFEANGTGQKVHDLIAHAQASAQNVRGVIVDLRNNGGGLLTEYVSAAAAFVPTLAGETVKFVDGSSASFQYSGGAVMRESSCRTPTAALEVDSPAVWNGKVAVLINGGSASGSEMFSANLRQGGKARLIGEETYGVGNTSTFLFSVPGDLGLSVTAGRVFLNGQQASQTVVPDTSVKDDLTVLSTGVDTALQTALAELGH